MATDHYSIRRPPTPTTSSTANSARVTTRSSRRAGGRAGVAETVTPSMDKVDIAVSSNFERFLFQTSGNDSAMMDGQAHG